MNILILGAAGGMSLSTIRDLLKTSGAARITLADIDAARIQDRAAHFADDRLTTLTVDLRNVDQVARAMEGTDVVINEASYQLNIYAMQAAMKAGVPLIDLGGLYTMTRKQIALHSEVSKSGILVIPGMGSDPGTSNVLCRYGADKLDEVAEIHIRFGASWTGRTFGFAVETILDEALKNAIFYENGEYKEVPALSLSEDVQFRDPVGTQKTFIILHSELGSVPQFIKGVKKVTYYDTWDPATIEKFKALIALDMLSGRQVHVLGQETQARKVTIDLLSELTRDQQATEGLDALQVTVKGQRNGRETSHVFEIRTPGKVGEGISPTCYSTGVPPSIVAQMIANGQVQGKGVLPPEACIDPQTYLGELLKRDFELFETEIQTHQR